MKDDELAKLLLADKINQKHIWVLELSDNGYINNIADLERIWSYAKGSDLDIRIMKPNDISTSDLHTNRVNIYLDENNKIIGVNRG